MAPAAPETAADDVGSVEALRDILTAMSSAGGNEAPVFDVILRHASRLCHTPFAGLYLVDEDRTAASLVASRGARSDYLERTLTHWPLGNPAAVPRAITGNHVVHLEDLVDTDAYRRGDRRRVDAVEIEGIRTFLAVPLTRNGIAIGAIGLYRREVRPFEPDDIRLVEAFAGQAVVAIESARQFRELQTRLEREAATREILEVINRSRDDEQPVFNTILQSARRLCGATMAAFVLGREGGGPQVMVAHHGATPETLELYRSGRFPMDPDVSTAARAIIERRTIHLEDMADTDAYRARHPNFVSLVDQQGIRTNLLVPLISQGVGIGCLILYRLKVQPYTADQIALVETFAAQAAIAIENVRQFRALEARTSEVEALNASLEARVEAQVGELERLARLKRFLSPQVADAVVSSGDEQLLGSHRALIAVLFCDIRGFTAFCETAEPEETIEILQTYHEEMGHLIRAYGAGVDHRSGDGIMAIFNDPLPCDDPAGDALRMALAMRERMAALSADWRRLGHRLGFGVGLSLGYATVGMVGSEGRYEYTASGTTVNLAARLCDQAADGEILLSPRAFRAVEESFAAEPHGELELKGISTPVEVFRVVGPSV